jgi:hypothetical protein
MGAQRSRRRGVPIRSPRPSHRANGESRSRIVGHASAHGGSLGVERSRIPDPARKDNEWREFIAQLDGPRHAEFEASRQRAGAHERTFLQSTPMGDMVIVTIEADDPGVAFGKMVSATDAFTLWFLEQVKSIHGVDLALPMPDGSPSKQVIDSRSLVAAK